MFGLCSLLLLGALTGCNVDKSDKEKVDLVTSSGSLYVKQVENLDEDDFDFEVSETDDFDINVFIDGG